MNKHNISPQWGVPYELIMCPGCGQLYGHHNTTVCMNCNECSTCHKNNPCTEPDMLPARLAIPVILEQ